MIYLGIDPGLGGAIAVLDTAEGVTVHKMPTRPRTVFKGNRVDWRELPDIVRGATRAAVEAQHSMPSDGKASAFTFGGAYEGCIAMLDACVVPYTEHSPKAWQGAFGIARGKGEPRSATKAKAKAIALSLFPTAVGITQQTADAVLLAEYARRASK